MRALLDVNVLLALLDSDHVDHRSARAWLESDIDHGWASCAITQNGFLRVVTHESYPSPVSTVEAARRLQRATDGAHHQFLPCDVSVLDEAIRAERIHGSKQVTDVYLLALALAHHCRFVTFDRTVPLSAVAGASAEHLLTL